MDSYPVRQKDFDFNQSLFYMQEESNPRGWSFRFTALLAQASWGTNH